RLVHYKKTADQIKHSAGQAHHEAVPLLRQEGMDDLETAANERTGTDEDGTCGDVTAGIELCDRAQRDQDDAEYDEPPPLPRDVRGDRALTFDACRHAKAPLISD